MNVRPLNEISYPYHWAATPTHITMDFESRLSSGEARVNDVTEYGTTLLHVRSDLPSDNPFYEPNAFA